MQPNATPGSDGRDCAPASTFHGAPSAPAFSPSIPTVEEVVLQRRKGEACSGKSPNFRQTSGAKGEPAGYASC